MTDELISYSRYTSWFAFPALKETKPGQLERIPAHRRFDRRVTKAGMDGLLRLLKRHVVECGTCSLCRGFAKNRPERYAAWRPARLLGGAA